MIITYKSEHVKLNIPDEVVEEYEKVVGPFDEMTLTTLDFDPSLLTAERLGYITTPREKMKHFFKKTLPPKLDKELSEVVTRNAKRQIYTFRKMKGMEPIS